MSQYALLCNPGHNRVYFQAAEQLSLGELNLALSRFSTPCEKGKVQEFGKVRYFTFTAAAPLKEQEIQLLSRLSFVYAIFLLGEGPLLRPVERYPGAFPEDLSAHLKYTGKTGEQFTRFLLNIAALCYAGNPLSRLKVLDPVCGKGTTLFEAMTLGYDGEGIDLNGKGISEGVGYLKKYLELGCYKHTLHKERISGPKKCFTAGTAVFVIGKDKAAVKEDPCRIKFVVGDSRYCPEIFGGNHFDLVVGDLPYGIQHQNIGAKGSGTGSRRPRELLTLCLPSWKAVLKPQGVLALSWNTFLLSRNDMVHLLGKAGFSVFQGGVFDCFSHRVDAAIMRDAVFACSENKN